MSRELFIDIETYSDVDLKKNSVYRYTESPVFEIMMAAWAEDDGPVQLALGAEEIAAIPGLFDDRVEKVAHNAAFERVCFSVLSRAVLAGELGFSAREALRRFGYLDPEQWTDTAALAAEWGYPRKLEHLAAVLGGEQKDTAGTHLINFFCKPDRNGNRRRPEDHPEKWQQFKDYCVQDVETLRDVRRKMGGWPTETERAVYMADQRINDRGIPVDVELAAHAVDMAAVNAVGQKAEVIELTGVENPNSNPQMLGWLQEQGVAVANLQAATVEALLAGELDPTVRRVLELRQELALVASKKFSAAISRTSSDGRLRGAFQFAGAHTGRWAGRGVQLQNLPREKLDTELDTLAAILDLKLGFDTDARTLKALVRAMFTGPFTVVDYAAIEARVVAWLAGEQWALDAFALGRDIYVETAERMGGLTRSEGKVAVLALGYNGGVNSLRVMGAQGSDEKLQFLVTQWREANPAIVNLWREMGDSFRFGGPVGEHLYIEKDGADRLVRLPSGRAVVYRGLKARWVHKWGKRVQVISFASTKAPGLREDTYGGKLTENITQAVARDVLADALLRLEARGYEAVGHVHDEILVLGADASSVERVKAVMVEPSPWAAGLPIAAEGFTCARYRKD